jgi:hypothetical protein
VLVALVVMHGCHTGGHDVDVEPVVFVDSKEHR